MDGVTCWPHRRGRDAADALRRSPDEVAGSWVLRQPALCAAVPSSAATPAGQLGRETINAPTFELDQSPGAGHSRAWAWALRRRVSAVAIDAAARLRSGGGPAPACARRRGSAESAGKKASGRSRTWSLSTRLCLHAAHLRIEPSFDTRAVAVADRGIRVCVHRSSSPMRATSPAVDWSSPGSAPALPRMTGARRCASAFPSSTPNWSKELMSHMAPIVNTLCS